jgi:hypothetical protein
MYSILLNKHTKSQILIYPLPEVEKNRLRIAARFLRQRGFKFDGQNNFYKEVSAVLDELDQTTRFELLDLVNWVAEYEEEEFKIFGQVSSRSRTMTKNTGIKKTNLFSKKPLLKPDRQALPRLTGINLKE